MTHRQLTSRERPAKRALSLDWIVAETIAIMRSEGLEKATMRRVAHALETGPASLYAYVANTAELHAAVTDELIGELPVDVDGDWRARLEALLGSYLDLLFGAPGLARSALVQRPFGPHALRFVDRVLGLLIEGGVPPAQAAWGADLLIHHATSVAAEHAGGADDAAAALERTVRAADPERTPWVASHRDDLLSGTPQERMAWGVRAVMAGIAATPVSHG